MTSFRREEDARLAVDAVNAQAGPHEDGLNPWATYRFDPNVRVRGVQTYTGYEDRLHGEAPRRGKTLRLVETESGMTVDGVVTEADDDKQLIYVAVDWSRLTVPDDTAISGECPATDGATHRLAEALLHIDRHGCTNYTGGARCLDPGSGRTRDAEYTAEKWCDACVARDAVYPSGGEPADTQRAAPTRDVLVTAFRASSVKRGGDPNQHPTHDEAERMADVALAALRTDSRDDLAEQAYAELSAIEEAVRAAGHKVSTVGPLRALRAVEAALRGAGADGGGEEAHVGETHVEGGHTLAHAAAELDDAHARVDVARDNVINGCVRDDLGRALAEIEVGRATLRLHRCPSEEVDDLARLASAAGVDPDAADPVGKIETVIREGRALPQPTSLADDQGVVADSFGLAAWVHDSGDTVYVNRDREVLVRPGRGQYVLSTGWLGQAILAAEQWADAHIEVGDEVTGDRAVTAPVGTKLGARNAAVAAVRTTGGWSVTGMSHEQDHEHAVRINEWVVLALGGRS